MQTDIIKHSESLQRPTFFFLSPHIYIYIYIYILFNMGKGKGGFSHLIRLQITFIITIHFTLQVLFKKFILLFFSISLTFQQFIIRHIP
jgi:hypothetical protein